MSPTPAPTGDLVIPTIPDGPELETAPAAHLVAIEARVRVQAVATPDPDGGYSVAVPALPGCFTSGATIEEAIANLAEAAEAWLEVAHDQGRGELVRGLTGE
jgi:predicted RNase H-like HicB family nuclease